MHPLRFETTLRAQHRTQRGTSQNPAPMQKPQSDYDPGQHTKHCPPKAE
jgi:hypothetical protein